MTGKALFIDPQRDAEQLAELARLQQLKGMTRASENTRKDHFGSHMGMQVGHIQVDMTRPISAEKLAQLDAQIGRERAADQYLQKSILKDVDFDRS